MILSSAIAIVKKMIRKATTNDIPRILELLSQVNDVHAEGRPDYFIKGKRKYEENELRKILTLCKHVYAALPVACVAKKCYLRSVLAWHYA